jgi:xanthine dehydrogenase accessory factor
MKAALLDTLNKARAEKKQIALITDVAEGIQTLIVDGEIVDGVEPTPNLRAEAAAAIANDRRKIVAAEDTRHFIHVFNPPKRMIVVGAVHIAQSLAPMAAIAGYDVTIIDPRGAFATVERFPGVTLCNEWPDDAMPKLNPDRRTAVVTLTHDPKIDDPALIAALRTDAFYIGSLGSRKTHASRLERLGKESFGDSDLTRIHGPIGLNIGAVSQAEIAISILGQITEVLHRARQDKTA